MQKPLFGYVIAATIGAVILVVVGYFVHAAPGGAVGFPFWLERPIRYGVHLWAMAGMLIGAGVQFVRAR